MIHLDAEGNVFYVCKQSEGVLDTFSETLIFWTFAHADSCRSEPTISGSDADWALAMPTQESSSLQEAPEGTLGSR